ncbi:SRPBCC family protein [Microlunatus panaciterrae]|uniref:Polyketide cyclase / dehydrase and lipid transport n=1 Tax=Microlunatus panaciterrae TaxID=400768 RepID=A0ABS2RG18_9ACTN|nr:SRPBCC family protein [Microlunatus panaciterrae]MBM7797936.1 hypothetical protein [Microlunatus panaciterrae]
MSVRLVASTVIAADPEVVWAALTDWSNQGDWIPLTTVEVLSDHQRGLGVRAAAFSGVSLGRIPLGLLDRFVVTGWRQPDSLEVLHLGPVFTGEGEFRLTTEPGGTRITGTEVFRLPGGPLSEAAARLLLPLLRWGLGRSLRTLGDRIEQASR